MCTSHFIKLRLTCLDNWYMAILTTCFSDLVDVLANLVQPENDLLCTHLSTPKVGKTFINFSWPSLSNFPS